MLVQTSRQNVMGLVAVLAVSLSVVSDASAGAVRETRFTVVESSSTSWVARGLTNYTVTEADGWSFAPSRNFDNGVGLSMNGPALPGTSITSWRLNFAAPFDAEIQPGFFPDFQRFPFQDPDRPGLEFSSTGRLDNRASGFYEVFEAVYGPGGEVISFGADFTHFGEENPNNWARVEVRFNAIPEPTSAALLLVGSLCALIRRR